jgi:hypothetical protein
MGTQKTRAEKIYWFPFYIHNLYELKQDNSTEKVIAAFCIKFFACKKTAVEILNFLISSGKILERDEKLYVFDDYEKFINSQFKNGNTTNGTGRPENSLEPSAKEITQS